MVLYFWEPATAGIRRNTLPKGWEMPLYDPERLHRAREYRPGADRA